LVKNCREYPRALFRVTAVNTKAQAEMLALSVMLSYRSSEEIEMSAVSEGVMGWIHSLTHHDDEDDVAKRFRHLAMNHLGLDEDKLTDSATFRDLGIDSLDMAEAMMSAEEEFGIAITDKQLESIHTVGEAIALIKRLLGVDKEAK
jgi:acyl carrier protein